MPAEPEPTPLRRRLAQYVTGFYVHSLNRKPWAR
jgi:hypothetical protein